jgi:hypothetical protein
LRRKAQPYKALPHPPPWPHPAKKPKLFIAISALKDSKQAISLYVYNRMKALIILQFKIRNFKLPTTTEEMPALVMFISLH